MVGLPAMTKFFQLTRLVQLRDDVLSLSKDEAGGRVEDVVRWQATDFAKDISFRAEFQVHRHVL